MDEYLTTPEALKLCGISKADEFLLSDLIKESFRVAGHLIFRKSDVLRVKREHYADGPTITELAEHNGICRYTVSKRLKRWHIKHIGLDRRRGNARVYSPSTLLKVKHVTGLNLPERYDLPGNPTDP